MKTKNKEEYNMANAKQLIKDIDKKLNNWDERSSFKLKGIGNLSYADMESLKLYAEEFLKRGNVNHFMKPLGDKKEILAKYGIERTSNW